MNIHEENELFSCTLCDKSIKDSLKRHTKQVHSDKIDKCSQYLKINKGKRYYNMIRDHENKMYT